MINITLIVEFIGKNVLDNAQGKLFDVYSYNFGNGKTLVDNDDVINPKDDDEKIMVN